MATETITETPQERLKRQMDEQAERTAAYAQGEGGEQIPGQQDLEGNEVPAPEPAANASAAGTLEGVTLEGPRQLSVYSTGGKEPKRAKLVLSSAGVELEPGTTFEKGDVLQLSLTAVVVGVADKDKLDKATGMVVECKRQLTAQVTDLWVPDE